LNGKKLTAEVKGIALKVGADLAGVVSAETIDAFPRHWIGWKTHDYTQKTTNIMEDAKSVIMLGCHVWDDILEVALRKKETWTYPGYFSLSTITQKIAFHLESKGYKVTAFPSRLPYKRLAQLAGFGAFGKNSLIINPNFGPWIRLGAVLTNVEMVADKPFEEDLCGNCENCIEACPVNALTPYQVDSEKCLVGIHLLDQEIPNTDLTKILSRYEPNLTKNSHLMCMECQKACRFGRNRL
jgi:epoxyqueuosine reductase